MNVTVKNPRRDIIGVETYRLLKELAKLMGERRVIDQQLEGWRLKNAIE